MTSAHRLTNNQIGLWRQIPSSSQSVFQTYSWSQLLSQVYLYPDYALTVGEDSDDFAIMPMKLVRSRLLGNRLISMPFSDYAGPTDSIIQNQGLLLEEASRLVKELKVDFLEVRVARAVSDRLGSEMKRLGFKPVREYSSFLIGLDGGEKKVWERTSSSMRRAVTKSRREDVSVVEVSTQRELREYYDLHVASSRQHGSPAHPFRFFSALYNQLGAKGEATFLLSTSHDRAIAGLLLLKHGPTTHYWQSALLNEYRRLNPFHLLLWEAIARSIEEGRARFDLGRTRAGSGVYRFKQAWGGAEYKLDHYCIFRGKEVRLADPEDTRYRVASLVWRKIPRPVTARLESRLIREIAL